MANIHPNVHAQLWKISILRPGIVSTAAQIECNSKPGCNAFEVPPNGDIVAVQSDVYWAGSSGGNGGFKAERMTNARRKRQRLQLLLAILAVLSVLAGSRDKAQDSVPATKLVSSSSGHAPRSSRAALYASLGAELTHYDVDAEHAELIKRDSVTLPGNVQYAWPHRSKQYFYVVWSTGGPPTPGVSSSGGRHGVSAFRIDPASGALHLLGEPVPLRSRPIHVSTDIPGTHVLIAYNDPSGVTVHRIQPDGTIGVEIQPRERLDVGIYAHQVRVDPLDKMVILVTRGNGPSANKPEDPGALKVFGYADGMLTNRESVAPGGGFNFQPRHLDFHPTRPWVFVSLERQSKIEVYEKLKNETLSPTPLFIKATLADPDHARPGQEAGTIHMHPNGRFVYVANRASGTADARGMPVFSGGENGIAVFSINQNSGEPTLIQNVDTRGMTPRTFALDPTARILVAANQLPFEMGDGTNASVAPPNLAVFRVRDDGKLDYIRKYDVPTDGGRMLFWMGIVPLP
jgi:6-phosphogluconolactonase